MFYLILIVVVWSNSTNIDRTIVIVEKVLALCIIWIVFSSLKQLLPLHLVNGKNIFGYFIIEHNNLAQFRVRKGKEHNDHVKGDPVSQEWLLIKLFQCPLRSEEN